MHTTRPTLRAGFTLVEMLVIAPIVILAIGAFLTVIISMTGEVLSSRGSNALAYNVQDALNRIEQDVKQSTTFLAQNNITLTAGEAQGYNNDATNFTNVGGTSGTSLILNSVVTNGNPLSLSSGVVYLANQPNDCSSTNVSVNAPMTMNIVYFVKDNTLWRRTIMPSNYASGSIRCSTPWQQPSCAPGYTAVFCKTNDVKLVDGVSADGFFVQYYANAAASSPNPTAANTGSSVADRNIALSSISTVGISISASQSVAGRTVERAGTLRASRLETNASSIANTAPTASPSTPVVTASYAYGQPSSVTFSWQPSTGGSVLYAVDYRINGGSWTSGFTNSTNRTYTVNTGSNNVTVEARVRASNSVGTSEYGTTSYGVPIWVPPAMQNGWRNYDSNYNKPGFTKTSAGIVMLRGLIAGGTASSGATLFRLPEGYRPEYKLTFETITNANVYSRVYVGADGWVFVEKADTGWLSLDGVYFPANGAVTFTNAMPFYNSWNSYTAVYGGINPVPGYGVDNVGRVHTRGVAAGGTTGSGLRIIGLPGSMIPDAVMIYPSESNSYAAVQIDNRTGVQGPGIQAAYGGTTYYSLMSMFYPSTSGGWTNLSLQNGWVHYGAPFSTPRYKKSADGIVTLTGLISSGSTTSDAIIATLPAGYRPTSGRTLYGIASSTVAMGRIDIDINGNIRYLVGGNGWLSLDGIHFIGE
jgi:Tfp pilus assembly protein PilE